MLKRLFSLLTIITKQKRLVFLLIIKRETRRFITINQTVNCLLPAAFFLLCPAHYIIFVFNFQRLFG